MIDLVKFITNTKYKHVQIVSIGTGIVNRYRYLLIFFMVWLHFGLIPNVKIPLYGMDDENVTNI